VSTYVRGTPEVDGKQGKPEKGIDMSKAESNVPKHRKVNRMTKAQAKEAMAKCETSNDTGSHYYLRCKKVAAGK